MTMPADSGGNPTQQPQPTPGLLDQYGQPVIGQQQPQPGTQQQQQPAGSQQQPDPNAGIDARIDARINELLAGNTGGQQPQQTGQGQPGQQGAAGTTRAPDPNDVREARLGAAQYLGDEFRFSSADERQLANGLASQAVHRLLGEGQSPDNAARAAAAEVSRQMQAMRDNTEAALLRRLRDRGMLPQGSGDPSPPAGTNQPPPSLEVKIQRARELAAEYNQANNSPAPTYQAPSTYSAEWARQMDAAIHNGADPPAAVR